MVSLKSIIHLNEIVTAIYNSGYLVAEIKLRFIIKIPSKVLERILF